MLALPSSTSIKREPELYTCLREMVSIPCFIYNIREDLFPAVSRSLDELVGIGAPGSGISVVLKRIHPVDRARVLENYVSEMSKLIKAKSQEVYKLQEIKFLIQDTSCEWLKCNVKMDVIGYDERGIPDRIFGIFGLQRATLDDLSKVDSCIRGSLFEDEFTISLNRWKDKIAATVCKSQNRKLLITNRERQVVNLISQGFPTKQIAERLGISFHTVETHRKKLFSKFNAHSATELLHLLVSKGIWYHP